MNKPDEVRFESELEQAERRWQDAYDASAETTKRSTNRSGIDIKPLYTPHDRSHENFFDDVGFPGEYPNTRGIYASMHRGRSWTQRQLIGWGSARGLQQAPEGDPGTRRNRAVPDSLQLGLSRLRR